jgi:hypothetical protein
VDSGVVPAASGVVPVGVGSGVVGVEVFVVATVDQVAAAYGADDPAAATAGLARATLAGNITNYAGAGLHPRVLARLACDSPLRRILLDKNGAVLNYGRSRRLATPHQKRALAVRDGGCIVPGCHIPPEWCDAHHTIPWERGGVTDLDSMVLLCPRHHTAHHHGSYPIQMRDGIPWVQLPSWQNPLRPWAKNHTHHHHRTAHAIATRLLPQPPLPLPTPRQHDEEPDGAAS